MTDHDEQHPSQDFAAALAAFEQEQEKSGQKAAPKVGDRVSGKIYSIGAEHAFVDLGGKAEGSIDLAELKDAEGELKYAVGDPIEATVATAEEGGTYVLRMKAAGGRRSAPIPGEIRQAFEASAPIEGTVTGVVKGGVSIDVLGARGFCPISQLDRRFVEDASSYVGRRLSFKVARYEEGPRGLNLVLSRRAFLEEEARAKAAELREKLVVGAIVPGTVTSLARYGAFVDLGGVEGLLHVSEMGYGRIEKPEDVVQVGQELSVQITKVEPGKDGQDRISLSLRALAPDPWAAASIEFPVGAHMRGRVARLQPFGAFVELGAGIDGLLHVSELGLHRRINHPNEVVQVGQEIDVRVLAVDVPRRRISLTLASPGSFEVYHGEEYAAEGYHEGHEGYAEGHEGYEGQEGYHEEGYVAEEYAAGEAVASEEEPPQA